ncbi:MAG: glycosyltransferase family 39 protein [Flavobacteriales bacterium]|nr:glycosyltransferase family 39 protein [Flavobacteriales bacterium]MBP7407222.1 glycosyltransferase family 39 protein [Flavobacteriales bacterium]
MTERTATLPPTISPRWLVPLLFVLTAIWPLFMHLDTLPLRIWDESRQAISAWEMLRGGDWLVAHFYGQPDMWSTKPPMLIWLQTTFFALIGPGELGLRLPSAIAAFLTGWFLLRTTTRQLSAPWLGLIACLLLYTSDGYIHMHVARSGDYDALLVLFMSTSAWALFRWSVDGKPRDLLWFFVLLTLGTLTKSVQALLFIPGLGIFLLARKRLLALFKARMLYLGLGVFVLCVGGFYLLRESANPGYLQAVWMNELGGRYGGSLEGHEEPWSFYTDMLMDHHFNLWWMLVPVGMLIGLVHREERLRQWTLLLICLGTTYLYVISSAGTKLEWYAAPLFPVLAALAAIPIHVVLQWTFTEQWSATFLSRRVLPWLFLFVVFVQPYSAVIGRTYFPKEYPWDEDIYAASHYLHKAVRGGPLEANVLCHDTYNAHLMFYLMVLNEQGHEIQSVNKHELQVGQRAMATEGYVKEVIERSYDHEILHEQGALRIYRITGIHEEPS